jgi:hypothetical protein
VDAKEGQSITVRNGPFSSFLIFFPLEFIGICNPECYYEECFWDGNDCDCEPGCKEFMKGDGTCNLVCYTENCNYDNGDCEGYCDVEVN